MFEYLKFIIELCESYQKKIVFVCHVHAVYLFN